MSLYEDIFPPIETFIDLEPEEIAPLVLKFLSEEGSQKLNMHNFSLGTDPNFISWAGTVKSQRDKAQRQMIVAWRWLERELFIAPEPGNIDWAFITDRGKQVLEDQDFNTYKKGYLLPSDGLDPILVRKVKQAFIRGDYDTAVFQAFKEVEIRVRKVARLPSSKFGVNLMRKAFKPTDGILTDKGAEKGEQQAIMELFSGAIGIFKNPRSHRDLSLSDPKEAADIIHLANQLLRIIESISMD